MGGLRGLDRAAHLKRTQILVRVTARLLAFTAHKAIVAIVRTAPLPLPLTRLVLPKAPHQLVPILSPLTADTDRSLAQSIEEAIYLLGRRRMPAAAKLFEPL
jgi:hypothetical protein